MPTYEFDFQGQSALVRTVVDNLLGEHPKCWDIVLPSGFNGDRFADAVRAGLMAGDRRPLPRVAVRGTDGINDKISNFIQSLHQSWFELDEAPRRLQRGDSNYLESLFAKLRTDNRRVILILKRFHRVLDHLKTWVLNLLRQEEQAFRLHTIVLTPLPLVSLRKWWEADGHFFCTSDYGNLRHDTELVRPMSEKEMEAVCASYGIAGSVVRFVYSLTGGFPEPTAELFHAWEREGRPDPTPAVRRRLAEMARDRMNEFVEKLDPTKSFTFRDRVIDLYHRTDTDDAVASLSVHPLGHLLIDGSGLRSEAIGAAAVQSALRSSTADGHGRTAWLKLSDRAHLLYARRQYAASARVIDAPIQAGSMPFHDRILRGHSVIMRELGGTDDDLLGNEVSAKKVLAELKNCRAVLDAGIPGLGALDVEKIRSRYLDVEDLANAAVAAANYRGRLERRIVDLLAGLAGASHRNDRAALLLLLCRFETARTTAGDTAALAYALPLPEQILRVWAFWAAGVNFYAAPDSADPIWNDVRTQWNSAQYGPLTIPESGSEFRSFPAFAAFALAKYLAIPGAAPPESDHKTLFAQLSKYEWVRNSGAHGVCWPARRQRADYFELIDRWLESACKASASGIGKSELLAAVEPMPTVTPRGEVRW